MYYKLYKYAFFTIKATNLATCHTFLVFEVNEQIIFKLF